MDPRIDTLVRDWSFRSCDPGYGGMQALADAEFSGSIDYESARAFMVNGRLVGITGGTIESFRARELTAQEADHPAVPLLCAMLSDDASVEGEYYTADTPIAEVNETLASGGFTGYLELSENVFSGDYFVVYHAGTAESVAILGTENRVIAGREAMQRAQDEVGIYEVKRVDIEVIEIPDPGAEDQRAAAAVESATEPEAGDAEDDGGPAEQPETPEEDAEPAPAEASEPEPVEEATDPTPSPERSAEPAEEAETKDLEERDIARLAEAAMSGSPDEATFAADPGGASRSESRGDEWLTIPALDPDRTTLIRGPGEDPEPEASNGPSTVDGEPEPAPDEPAPEPAASATPDEEMVEQLEETEREKERLMARIEELETRLDAVADDAPAAGAAPASTPSQDITPTAALDGTNLFVRYDSKADFTLSDAASSGAERADVQENIRLEWHTTFDDENARVNGETYAEFLQSSIEYRFAEWLVAELLFELRETGGQRSFEDLYAAIPEIDRVEFSGGVPIHTQEGDERDSQTYDFDVIFRNGMGDPLLVAAVHDSREPADAAAVGTLMTDAHEVANERENVRAALFVTSSYFAPEAISTVAEATGGGFLRGSSKESFVSVSRKRGFHLCLVEARNETFHLNVPDS